MSRTVQSSEKPELIDETSSSDVVYVRKNLREITIDTEDEPINMWEYEEDTVPKDMWPMHYANMKLSAEVAYISMMNDYDWGDDE